MYLIEKPYAAAIGSGLPVYEPIGSMVVDIGGGTTDVAVVSLGGLVVAQSIQVGGMKMDEAIVNYIKKEFQLIIGERTAEDVKLDLASAVPLNDPRRVKIRGRAVNSPVPQDIDFTTAQAAEAIKEPCMAILAAIKWVLERTPPELAADVMRGGIHLTGGGAQLVWTGSVYCHRAGYSRCCWRRNPWTAPRWDWGIWWRILQLLQSIGKQGFMQVE